MLPGAFGFHSDHKGIIEMNNNERIIRNAIDKYFGTGAFDMMKNSKEAIEILLDYISKTATIKEAV